MGKRFLVGFVITVALFAIARRTSSNRPGRIEVEAGGLHLSHVEVKEQVGPGEPEVRLSVAPAGSGEAWVLSRSSRDGMVAHRPMARAETGEWTATLPDLGKGKRIEYAFSVTGERRVIARLPAGKDDFLLVKYKGQYSMPVLVLHIVFMFGSFYFMVQTMMGAVQILREREGKLITVRMMRLAMICVFIGGWPLGFILNYQRFGPVWEGFPFGLDITDNKTQIIFLFWLTAMILVRGSFFGKGEQFDTLGDRGFAWAMVTCFIVSMFLYLVPHSL